MHVRYRVLESIQNFSFQVFLNISCHANKAKYIKSEVHQDVCLPVFELLNLSCILNLKITRSTK